MKNRIKLILKKIFNFFLVFLKYVFGLFIILSVILLISIFISSLNSYKQSDFNNISKDFFKTKHHDKDFNSGENGFNEYLDFINYLENNEYRREIKYFSWNGRCSFDINNYSSCLSERNNFFNRDIFYEIIKGGHDKQVISKYIYGFDDQIDKKLDRYLKKELGKSFYDIISKQENDLYRKEFVKNSYKKFKIFYFINKAKFHTINEKKFIKMDYDNPIAHSYLITYLRSTIHLVYEEFERGNIEAGVNILINNQEFIDNLLHKSDVDWLGNLILITLNKTNIESINYFVENYEFSDNLKHKISNTLNKNLKNNGLITNGLKHDYNYMKNFIGKSSIKDLPYFLSDIPLGKLLHYSLYTLFYSKNETLLLLKNHYYYLIKNESQDTTSFDFNLNNYLGREFINDQKKYNIKKWFDKEKELLKLRKELIEKLN